MSKAFAFAGGAARLPGRRPGRRRRGAARPAAVPPLRAHPGRRAGRAGARATRCSRTVEAIKEQRDRIVADAARPRADRSPTATPTSSCSEQFRERPEGGLAGPARPRRAGPRRRPARLAAGHRGHAGGDRRVPDRDGRAADEHARSAGSSGPPRRPRSSSRSTSTAPARPSIATGVGFYDHMLAPARPARRLRPDRADRGRPARSTRTTRWRTPRSRSARRSREALGDKAGIRRFGNAHGAAGRGARAGRRRPVRPAVRRARRAATSRRTSGRSTRPA